jgi:hypothetical protein
LVAWDGGEVPANVVVSMSEADQPQQHGVFAVYAKY